MSFNAGLTSQASDRKDTHSFLQFEQNQLLTNLEDFSIKKGGYFWNRIQFKAPKATLEEDAFERLTGLMYRRKYEKENGVPAEQNKRRLQLEFGGQPHQYTFAQVIEKFKAPSVIGKVYFRNKESTWKRLAQANASNQKRFSQLDSKQLKPMNPVNISKYLCTQSISDVLFNSNEIPDEKKYIFQDSRLEEVIKRTPFFMSVADFKKAADDIFALRYERIAHVYYILAEYWSEMFYRTSVLYNVELLTYYSELFEGFNIKSKAFLTDDEKVKLQEKLKRLNDIRKQLSKGDAGKHVQNALQGNSDHSSLGSTLIDDHTGLPLDSPLLYYNSDPYKRYGGAPWPLNQVFEKDAEIKELKTTEVAQILQLLLAEPILLNQIHPEIPNKVEPDVFLLQSYEPVCTATTDEAQNQYDIYLDDIRCKLLAALRETRKYMVLANFLRSTEATGDDDLVEKIDSIIAKRREGIPNGEEMKLKVEDRADLLFQKAVLPTINDLNNKVTDNFKASIKHFSDKKTTADRYSSPSELLLTGLDLMTPFVSSPAFSTPAQSYSILQNYSSPLSSRRVPL